MGSYHKLKFLFLSLAVSISAQAAVPPVTITPIPKTNFPYAAEVGISIVNTDPNNSFQLQFSLQNETDGAVSIDSGKNKNLPIPCGNTIGSNSTCILWLHSVDGKSLGLVKEGEIVINVADLGVSIETASFNLENETDLYAAGFFTSAFNTDDSAVTVNYIAKWDGSQWSALGSGLNQASTSMALTAGIDGTVYVSGYFTQPAAGIAAWNPATQKWSALNSGLSGNGQGNIALTTSTDGTLYATGNFTNAGGNPVNYVAKWDGQTWAALGSGFDKGGVALTTGTDGAIYAGGNFRYAGNKQVNYIAKWDPALQQWSSLSGGVFYNAGTLPTMVNALTQGNNGDIYAGGFFNTAGGLTMANNIAKFSATTQQWSALGNGLLISTGNASVNALTTASDGTVYAGGHFDQSGSINANNIAKWDGNHWSALGGGVNDTVFTLLAGSDSEIYAGGYFTQVDGKPVNYIAKWDPAMQQWSTLGNGFSNAVYALVMAPVLQILPNQ